MIGMVVLLFSFFAGLTTVYTNKEVRTKAAGPVCDDRCVHELDCCKAIKANGDPYECAWPDRGWCFPSTCAPYNGQHTNCGWYWKFHNANDNEYHIGTNTAEGYGCMIGPDEASMRPICNGRGGKPSNTPRPAQPKPTNTPKQRGTISSTPIPTDSFILPSQDPHVQPTTLPATQVPQPTDDDNFSRPTQGNYPTDSPNFEQRPILQPQISPTTKPQFHIPLDEIQGKLGNSFQTIKETVITFFITILP